MKIPKRWRDRGGKSKFNFMLNAAYNRVFSPGEKGQTRHGKGRPLLEQPAFQVRPNNPGFFTGQAMKKIIEAMEWEDDSGEELEPETIIHFQLKEYVDAIAYLVFEMIYQVEKIEAGEFINENKDV